MEKFKKMNFDKPHFGPEDPDIQSIDIQKAIKKQAYAEGLKAQIEERQR